MVALPRRDESPSSEAEFDPTLSASFDRPGPKEQALANILVDIGLGDVKSRETASDEGAIAPVIELQTGKPQPSEAQLGASRANLRALWARRSQGEALSA